MKKTLIILIPALALLWLLILPVTVGSYLRAWVPEWLEEVGLQDNARFTSGWFTSALEMEQVSDLDITARHFPPLGLDWISLDGEVTSFVSSSPFLLQGEVGLSGASRFELTGDVLSLTDPIQINASMARLTLAQQLSQPSTLVLQMTALALADELGNRLHSESTQLDLGWSALDEDNLALTLHLNVEAAAPMELALSAQPVQREALADLIDGLQQLVQAQPRSAAQQFALLTVAGAWQQLSQNGLSIELESLIVGDDSRFEGDWVTAEGQPEVIGSGSTSSLKSALLPLVGLSARLAPTQADQIIEAWLEQLIRRGWLSVEDERFQFRYDATLRDD